MKINAIIFDFGGVLIKWAPHKIFYNHFSGGTEQVHNFLQEIHFFDWNAQQDRGRGFSEGISILKQDYPQYHRVFEALSSNWEASLDGEISGSIDLLESLKDRGFAVYGLSNWSTETFPLARAKYTFFDLFDDIIISGEVKLIKPEAAIFEYCLRRIAKRAGECLFIDDAEPNIRAASKLGLEAVLFKSPTQLRRTLIGRGILE